MNRKKFLFSTLAILPLVAAAKKLVRDTKGFFVASGGTRLAESLKLKGITVNHLDVKISTADTDGDQLLIEQTGLSLNGGPALHIHHFQDEFVYVLEGEYIFQVGEVKHLLKKGDTIFLPRGIQHAFTQKTAQARFLLHYQPAGKMEAFFTAITKQQRPPTPQEMNKMFEDHDMKITGGRVKE
jgi:quercetin dioxygenase-like cupin family protein